VDRWGQESQCRAGVRKAICFDGACRPLEKLDHLLQPHRINCRPVEATVLDAFAGKVERGLVKQHVEEARSESKEIVAGRNGCTAFGSVTGVQGIATARRAAGFADRVVVGQHHIAARDNDVARADVSVHQTHLM
jgi:hypothetical protein